MRRFTEEAVGFRDEAMERSIFMRKTWMALFYLFLTAAAAQAQEAVGMITGIVENGEGDAIAGAVVEAENAETGARSEVRTAANGHFTFFNMQPGVYNISISHEKYEPFAYKGLYVSATQSSHIDFFLREKDADDSYDFDADTSRPRFDNSQWVHNIESEAVTSSPMLGFPTGKFTEGRIRNPLDAVQRTTGSLMTPQEYFRINGAPSNTHSIRIEGHDANNGLLLSQTMQNQVGIEAVDEFAFQTSNYAAEFGQAGGGIVNIALRSGSNAYHGSGYEYWANEILNANQPYINIKPRNRRNDYGFTFGGPLRVPGYDGRNKTFFFVNFEQFRQKIVYENQYITVPTKAYREGDFRKALTGRRLGTDPLGRPIMEGAVYDPATERIVDGQRVRNTFPRNTIPKSRMDPVALKIQELIPLPTNSNTDDNYRVSWVSPQLDSLGSIRLDQKFSRSSLSFYFGHNREDSSQRLDQGGDGILTAVTGNRPTDIRANTFFLTYDRSLSPSRLFRLSFGYQWLRWSDAVENDTFDQEKELGLRGANLTIFPHITGLKAPMGGMKDMGPSMQSLSTMHKPSANASLAWLKGSHTYKFGGELRLESYPSTVRYPAYGYYNFSAEQTGLPSTYGQNLQGGTVGFPYASFLLGLVKNGDIGVVSTPRLGKHAWALFAQDSWKVTPLLTLEYGLRYDYQTYLKESEGRIPSFSPTVKNPSAGNLPGYVIYEGSGPGRCNCDFAKVYPYAFGPRLGVSYELFSRIVVRAGWAIVYGQTAAENRAAIRWGSANAFTSTIYGNEALRLRDGAPASEPWPSFNTDRYLIGNGGSLTAVDINAGRPPRQMQFTLSGQAQLSRNFTVELGFVIMRGSGWESNGLINVNALTPSRLKDLGLDIGKEADRKLLLAPISSSLAAQRGFSTLPYAGFPSTATVAQSLRPFPQYGDIAYRWAPFGKTWYESAQLKVNKRYSRGFAFSFGFSYQREKALGAENMGGAYTSLEIVNNVNDPKNNRHISALSRPVVVFFAPTFTFPSFSGRRTLSPLLRNWTFSAFLQYASGLPIPAPVSNNGLSSLLFQSTFANRVGSEGFFKKDLNSRDINPMKEFVLNPKAWEDPEAGKFSAGSAFYAKYRFRRRPVEQMSFGRTFRVNDTVSLVLRIDFQNVFNRIQMADPVYDNAGATQVFDSKDVPQSGFGYIDYRKVGGNPRNGQVVVRLQF